MQGHDQSPGRNDTEHVVKAPPDEFERLNWLAAELERVRKYGNELESALAAMVDLYTNGYPESEHAAAVVAKARELLDQ